MIAWAVIKTFLGSAGRFIAAHWQAIAVALIVAVALHYKTAYEHTAQELAAFKSDIAKAVEMKQVADKLKRNQAAKEVAAAEEKHKQQIEGIKYEYEKRNKISSITINALRSELRTKISDSFTLPIITPDSSATASEWQNSYAAISGQYESLREACTITTIDYNALRTWADSACDQVGCN